MTWINYIAAPIAAAGITLYWFNVARLNQYVNFKPFNCEPCFAFWLTLGLVFLPANVLFTIISITFAFLVYKLIKIFYEQ